MVAFTSFDLDPFNETTLLTEMGWALGVMCELL